MTTTDNATAAEARPSTEPDAVGPVGAAGPRFPVAGIGASAGGLEALEALTARLAPVEMAFVVLQHLAPEHDSLLPEILARTCRLPVVTLTDGLALAPGVVYVTPAGVEVGLDGGVLVLRPIAAEIPHHSIDTFFRALARDLGSRAIGVVLSGAGSDGTLGLRAIKDAGGIALAQEPTTAVHPSMPQSALAAGCVDACLSAAAIGDELMRLAAHPYVATRRPGPAFDGDALASLLARLQTSFGVDFAAYKLGTVERRVERRMALQRLERVEDYLRYVDADPGELAVLYSDLLIGVTGFFRDREPFATLRSIVFPRLFDRRRPDSPIRIWVPGCATGEEAYSIAICLLEYLDGRVAQHRIQIFATDVDDHALAIGRQGVYPATIAGDVDAGRLQRFFARHDQGYQVARSVRDLIVFAHHNLAKDPPFSRLDLVSCRNVLIYLRPPLQKRVLRVFHYALNPDAFLLLGSSESVGDAGDLFSLVDRKLKLYVKKNTSSPTVLDFHGRPTPTGPVADAAGPPAPTAHRAAINIQQLADQTVLERFGPPGLLVNDRHDVVQFRGHTGPFLGPSPGVATLNVLKLIRPEFLVELRMALQQVAAEGLPVTSPPVRLAPEQPPVVLELMPLQEPGAQARCTLILFHELASDAPVAAIVDPAAAVAGADDTRLKELARELLVTKEYLQSAVEEFEASNEELQSSNEELQSSNEELQSSNEELETSKEELQSTNEELATINDELHSRMLQLSVANDDLQNVLALVDAAFVIVGMDLRIRRYSAEAERLLSLIPGDVGRPVAYLGTALGEPDLETAVRETIDTVRPREDRVRCSDGRWYTLRVLPYRTSEHAIRGAIVELLRQPLAKRPSQPIEIQDLIARVLSSLPQALMLLDDQLRITWVNRAFFETFTFGAEIVGRPLEDVWPSRASHPALWRALDQTASQATGFAELAVPQPFGRPGDRAMRFAARPIVLDGDRPPLTLLMIDEPPLGGAP